MFRCFGLAVVQMAHTLLEWTFCSKQYLFSLMTTVTPCSLSWQIKFSDRTAFSMHHNCPKILFFVPDLTCSCSQNYQQCSSSRPSYQQEHRSEHYVGQKKFQRLSLCPLCVGVIALSTLVSDFPYLGHKKGMSGEYSLLWIGNSWFSSYLGWPLV